MFLLKSISFIVTYCANISFDSPAFYVIATIRCIAEQDKRSLVIIMVLRKSVNF